VFLPHGSTRLPLGAALSAHLVAPGKVTRWDASNTQPHGSSGRFARAIFVPRRITRIELISFEGCYPKLYPRGVARGSAAARAFTIFKGHCLRCQSINLEGGTAGPELNVPRSITEYWSRDVLRAFIRNVSAFRLKSKMPVFTGIVTPAQIDDVLSYRDAMSDHKIGPSVAVPSP
jgi:hypothetical protein